MKHVVAVLSLGFCASMSLAQKPDLSQMSAPEYATVQDIPETAITSLPFVIRSSGFYYLKTNLTLETPGTDGIVVMADKVGIDGFGHTIRGPGEGSGNGIAQHPTNFVLILANATLSGWCGDGKYAVWAPGGGNDLQNVRMIRNSGGVLSGQGSTVISNTVQSTFTKGAGYGVYAQTGSTVANCEVLDVTGSLDAHGIRVDSNSTVYGCTVRNVSSDGACYGIFAGAVCRIVDCDVRFCRGGSETGAGIRAMGTSVFRTTWPPTTAVTVSGWRAFPEPSPTRCRATAEPAFTSTVPWIELKAIPS